MSDEGSHESESGLSHGQVCQVSQCPQCYSDFNRSEFLIKLMISAAESKHKTHPVLVIQIFNPSLGIPSCLRVGSSQAWN